MHYSNFEKVEQLREQLRRLQTAHDELGNNMSALAETDDGAYAYISRHSDGSGTIVDLHGCHVGTELTYAAYAIVGKKIEKTITELEALGVTFG
jgi:hypothetical protein